MIDAIIGMIVIALLILGLTSLEKFEKKLDAWVSGKSKKKRRKKD